MSLSKRLGQNDSENAKSFPDLAKLTEELRPRIEATNQNDPSIKNQVLETLIQSLGQQLYSGQVDEKVLELEDLKKTNEPFNITTVDGKNMYFININYFHFIHKIILFYFYLNILEI